MKNKIFESPQKSQTNVLYRKLNLDQQSQTLIEELIEQQSFYDLKDQKFKDLPENQKIVCAIFILYFQNQLVELQNVSLSLLVDKIFLFKKKCQEIKLTFRIIRELKKQQKIEIPNFEQVHNTIGYYGIMFTIFKKVKCSFGNVFQDENFKKIWVILVLLAKQEDLKLPITFQQILDLMSALLLYQLQKNTTHDNFNFKRQQLANYSYELNDEEFENYKIKIDQEIPDFHDPFFDSQQYIQQFYQIKEKYDIDYLIFLEENNEKSENSKKHVMLTPIIRNSVCTSKSSKNLNNNIFKNSPLQDISLDSHFDDIQNQINSKKQRLLSPTLKKQFDESDRTLDLPKMFQWYKNIIKDVEITKVTIDKHTYQVNVKLSDTLQSQKIRDNYRKIYQITENFQTTRKNILKLFFALMQQFLKNELEKSEKHKIYEVFKESEFMLSLFCLSLSIDSLITQNNKQKIQEYISMCQISFFSFWKILSLLAKNLANNLPVIIRSRIVELEHYILLKLIWQTDKNSNNEADVILKQTAIQHQVAMKQLLYILIERIYLISQGINLSPLFVQKVWEFMTHLLQQHTKSQKTRLENIHLDQILILIFNHIRIVNCIYGGLAQILKVYNDKCLFPIVNLSKEALVQYYKYDFQELLNNSQDIQFKIKKQKKVNENPNSTPIGNQLKKFPQQIKESPQIDSFEFKMDKKQQQDSDTCSLFTRRDSIKFIKKQSRISFQQGNEQNDPSLNQNIRSNSELMCWSKLSENNMDQKEVPADNITMITPFFTEDDFQHEAKNSGQKTPTF